MNNERNPSQGGSHSMLELSRCSSCLKLIEGEIFICKKGHPICNKCYPKTKSRNSKCSKCKASLPLKNKIRNENLEGILDSMVFDCGFSEKGCNKKLTRQMLTKHSKTCRYRKLSGLQKNPMSAGDPSSTQNTAAGTSVVVKTENKASSLLQLSQGELDFSRYGEISNESYPVPVPEIKIEEDCEDVDGEAEEVEEEEYYPVSITKIEELILPLDDVLENEVKVENSCEENPNVSFGSEFDLTTESQVCDIFSLSSDKLSKLISEPELMNQYMECEIIVDEERSSKISKVLELLSKCGNQFTGLLVRMRYVEDNFQFLKRALQIVTKVKSLTYQYQHGQDVLQFLTVLKVGKEEGHFPDLNLLKLFSASYSGSESLTNEHVTMLSEVGIQFESLEIGDSLWEDVKPESVRKLLENCKSSLETLIIHGGYRGRSDKTQKVLTFPQMEILSTFELCPNYEFVSEVKNPSFLFEKSQIENLTSENQHFKIAVKLGNSFPKLTHLVLGSLIEIEDLCFSTVRNLTEFQCGCYWNLSLNFPPDSCRKSSLQSNVTKIQFPDALKDPSFPEKVRKHFPNLRQVHINLPSVAVLQAFIKAFENSLVIILYLKTQFDFSSNLDSCLLPGTTCVKAQNEETKSLIRALKEYKHFEEYATYFNLELPPEQSENVVEASYPGIAGLKNLKRFHYEHISRELFIPVKDEEKKWYDYECKFRSTTINSKVYHMSKESHQEILKIHLIGYKPQYIESPVSAKDGCSHKSLFSSNHEDWETWDPVKEMTGEASGAKKTDSECHYSPVRHIIGCSAQVKIMPSMLLPDKNIKLE